jgi:hypothetical protein
MATEDGDWRWLARASFVLPDRRSQSAIAILNPNPEALSSIAVTPAPFIASIEKRVAPVGLPPYLPLDE